MINNRYGGKLFLFAAMMASSMSANTFADNLPLPRTRSIIVGGRRNSTGKCQKHRSIKIKNRRKKNKMARRSRQQNRK